MRSIVWDFTVFSDTGSGLVKIVAGYRQFHVVHYAVEYAHSFPCGLDCGPSGHGGSDPGGYYQP